MDSFYNYCLNLNILCLKDELIFFASNFFIFKLRPNLLFDFNLDWIFVQKLWVNLREGINLCIDSSEINRIFIFSKIQ